MAGGLCQFLLFVEREACISTSIARNGFWRPASPLASITSRFVTFFFFLHLYYYCFFFGYPVYHLLNQISSYFNSLSTSGSKTIQLKHHVTYQISPSFIHLGRLNHSNAFARFYRLILGVSTDCGQRAERYCECKIKFERTRVCSLPGLADVISFAYL